MPRLRAAFSARSFSSFRIGLRGHLDLGQVGFQAHAVQARGLQILGGADKGAGPPAHGRAQGAEIAARLRGQKDHGLLRFGGNGDKHAFFAHFAGPGFDAGKPLRRRRISDPAQERDDQYIMRGLALGKVGMNPEPVAGQQAGNLADGQRDLSPLHMNIDLWSDEVKGRISSVQSD